MLRAELRARRKRKVNIDDVLKAVIDGCNPLTFGFYQRKIKQDETITQYEMALQDLLEKAIPSMQQAEQDVLRNQLNLCLPNHLKVIMQFSIEKTFEDLLSCLERTYSQFASKPISNAYLKFSESSNRPKENVHFQNQIHNQSSKHQQRTSPYKPRKNNFPKIICNH